MPLLRCIRDSSIRSGEHFTGSVPDSIKEPKSKELIREWIGNLSEEQGLVGPVKEQDLKRIFNSELTPEYIMGGQCSTSEGSVNPGYELVFSLNPQLTQVVSGSVRKELADKVFLAHVQSVKIALHEVEMMVSAKLSNPGSFVYESTQSFLAALITHFPCSDDPELHTYALILNVTKCSNGVWAPIYDGTRDFHSRLLRQLDYLEGVYQLELAKRIQKLGFSIKRTGIDGKFNVYGLPIPDGSHFNP